MKWKTLPRKWSIHRVLRRVNDEICRMRTQLERNIYRSPNTIHHDHNGAHILIISCTKSVISCKGTIFFSHARLQGISFSSYCDSIWHKLSQYGKKILYTYLYHIVYYLGNCEALHEITDLVHQMLSVCAPIWNIYLLVYGASIFWVELLFLEQNIKH